MSQPQAEARKALWNGVEIPVARPARENRSPGPPALLWLPAVVVVSLTVLPLLYLVVRAAGAGAEAWDLLFRARTLDLFLRSAGLALAVTLAAVAIALPLAWLTTRSDLPLRRAWSVLLALPLVIPSYVGGFVLVAALGPRGILQGLLEGPFGVQRLPEIYGFPGAMLALTLFSYPYLLLSLRAGLQGRDPALEEASRSLGHGAWSTFRRVTLPQLRPAGASGALLVALYALSDFGVVSLLQFDSFTRAIYLQYQGSFDRTMAALLALLLVLLTAALLFAESRTRGRAQYTGGSSGAGRAHHPVRLGRWRWPAFAFCAVVATLALFIPLGVMAYWAARGLAQGNTLTPIWQAALNSLYVSGLAALAAVVGALPVAILAVRFRGRASHLLERSVYIGYALPGIVVALALVFFAANYAFPLYQTLALLVLAYVVRFVPQALGSLRSSLLQISPSLEEAARGLGRTHAQTLLAVTIPLMRPGILAGFALVFLTTMKELPVTLLLSPIGFKTLATTVWTATADGYFGEAAVPALLLVVASGVSMFFLTREEGGTRREGRVDGE